MFAITDFNRAFLLLSGKLTRWLQEFILLLPNLLIAGLILAITFWVAKLVRRLVGRFLERVSGSGSLNNLIVTTAYVGVLVVGGFFTLEILSLDKTVTSLLAGVGIIGLALGFAFQDIAANFISGVIIAVQRPFLAGDVIQTDTFFGTIERINLRTLDLRQVTGELVRVPNRKVFESAVTNFTATPQRRVDISCGASYAADLEHVRAVALASMADFPGLLPGRPVEVMFTAFAESSVSFTLRFWITFNKQVDYVGAKSEAIIRLKRALDDAGLGVPYPTRTLDLGSDTIQQLGQMLAGREVLVA